MTLTFDSLQAVVMAYARAKNQGQGSKAGLETDGRTDTTDCSI